jgi:hypothetical protein
MIEDFDRIFRRVRGIVTFHKANNATEINRRIQVKVDEFPPKLSPGKIEFLRKLIPWFGVAAIDDARKNPYGEVALTLKYGTKAAQLIMEEQARQYLEYLRKKAKKKKYRRKK